MRRYSASVGGYGFWPTGRGMFYAPGTLSDSIAAWVNEEDHLRLMVVRKDAGLLEAYNALVKVDSEIHNHLTFSYSDSLGYLTQCPSNVGTGMRVSVHIRIPKTAALIHFKDICNHLQLEVRGIGGECSDAGEGGVYNISNKYKLGQSEIDIMKYTIKAIHIIIELEQSLEESSN